MSFRAGMDWSGTPDLMSLDARHDPYVVMIAAVAVPLDRIYETFQRLRRRFKMLSDQEFHGHELSEDHQFAYLQTVAAMDIRLGALIVDKRMTRDVRNVADLPSGAKFQIAATLLLLKRFLPMYPLRAIWCDEDIQGDRQKAFSKEVRRIQRAAWPELSIQVRHQKSNHRDLIQMADVIAYGLARETRGSVESENLRGILMVFREDPRHLILGPMPW